MRGKDGVETITRNSDGVIVDTKITTVPEPGHTVQLTIDSEFQKAVDQALAKNVEWIKNTYADSKQANAGAVVFSRSQLADAAQREAAQEHLNRALAACKCSRTFRPGELLTKPWDQWGSEDFAAIDRCGCRQASCEKLHFDEHRAFGSAYFLELGLSCQQLEQNIPALFTDPACGHVLRAKGFVQDENGWVELNATADGLTANAIPKGQEVLIVIGEGLEKERIEVRLKG